MTREIPVGEVAIGGNRPFCLIAGPCVIEDERSLLALAESIARIAADLRRPLVFKASFDKANRSSASSFRGPGLREGLRILSGVRRRLGIPVTSDIHEPAQAAEAADVLDLIQIPAFLCRQTDLLVAAGKTGRPVNVKKGQFLSPAETANIIAKVASTGNDRVLITERGTSFGYQDLVSDFRSLPILRGLGCPVVYDATHSVQQPGRLGTASGGSRQFVPHLARAAIAVGCDALFLEVHGRPEQALSDAATMLPLDDLRPLLGQLARIEAAVRHD